ncbi:MAG: hypothetical protein STSR0008_09310 [Ignavibacterium sp.]
MIEEKQLSDKKKESIIEATKELIIKYGFLKTTLDDIAAEIGMKKSSLYYYYNNKEAILFDVIKKETALYYYEMEKEVNKVSGCINKIMVFEKVNLHFFKKSITLYELTISKIWEIKNLIDNLYKDFISQEVSFLKKIIDEGVQNNELQVCDSSRLANAIVTILESVKYKEIYYSSSPILKDINFNKVENDFRFIIKLLFNGLNVVHKNQN